MAIDTNYECAGPMPTKKDRKRSRISSNGVSQQLRQQATSNSPEVFTRSDKHPLDSPENQEKLRKLMMWRRQARVAQADNRMEQAIDEDYYDGIQYTPEDLHVLLERNQPPLVYNVTKNTINFILGTERRARMDSRVLPRKKSSASSAKTKTKIMKYTQDVSKGEFEWSMAFTDAVKAGIGWIENGARKDGDEPIFMRHESWRNMWFDHLGRSLDGKDWRYVIREKWCDLDIAEELFPERADSLKVMAEAANSLYPYLPEDIVISDTASEFDIESDLDALFGGPFDGIRERVKLIEGWYRMPARVQIMHERQAGDTPYGALDGKIFRGDNEDHKYLVKGNWFTLTDCLTMTVRCAIWVGATLLQDDLSPYYHNRFPFTPLFCYRRSRDNMPYGVIRDMRDPQSDLNKRRSRSLFLLSANRVIHDKGAVDDKVKAYEEVNRPDGMIEVNDGKRFEINKEIQEIAVHTEMARDDERFISNITGVTPEARGQSERDLSGVAIGKLQMQTQTTSGVFFDNYYYARQNEGEIRLNLIEQFCDKEKEYRITGDQGKDEFIKANEFKDGKIENNITESQADFIMGKQDYRESLRMAMFETLSQLVTSLAQSMPQVALALLDEVIEFMDELPNKDEIVARIRKINGQNAPEDEMTPEDKQQMKQAEEEKNKEQQMMKQLQQGMAQIALALQQAKVSETNARAMKDKIDGEMKRLEGFLKAMEVAATVQVAPQLTEAADQIVAEAMDQPQGEPGGPQA